MKRIAHFLAALALPTQSIFGTVVSTESQWIDTLHDGRTIFTQVQVQVEDGSQRSFRIPGGTVGEWSLEVSGYPLTQAGDKWLTTLTLDEEGNWESLLDSEAVIFSISSPEPRALWSLDSPQIDFYVNPANRDVSEQAALDAILFAADVWNDASIGASVHLSFAGSISAPSRSLNGKNEIIFVDEVSPNGSTVNAVTYTLRRGGVRVESDIVFWDRAKNLFTGSSGCVDGIYIEDTAVHEFGHFVGIGHTLNPNASMYGKARNCTRERRSLDQEDRDILKALYPPRP
jgi:hypothetical protein